MSDHELLIKKIVDTLVSKFDIGQVEYENNEERFRFADYHDMYEVVAQALPPEQRANQEQNQA